MDPRTALIGIEQMIPQMRNVVIDPGHHLNFSGAYLSAPNPRAFVVTNDFSAIGTAPAVAMGAAVATPDRPTVLAVGDGAMMMSLADLQTAAHYRLPLIVLVINDSALGAEAHYLDVSGFPSELALLDNPSFESVASSLGLTGRTVSTAEDLVGLQSALSNLTGPVLIDCRVTRRVRADSIEFYYLGRGRLSS
jgi:thiamine pyrophosphate-dependent acetolactate synthase large subunit-like protein